MRIVRAHLLALVACVAFTHSLLVAQPQENSITPATRTVTATEIGHYKNGSSPVDLSAVTVAVYAPNGSGGYNVISGSGTSAGTFTISNAPTGSYLLQLGSTFLVTDSVVDADFAYGYRSNGVPANSSTTVTFDLTNLNTWQSNDVFEVVCPNNAAYTEFNGTLGETAFVGTFPYAPFFMVNLSDASQRDRSAACLLQPQPEPSFHPSSRKRRDPILRSTGHSLRLLRIMCLKRTSMELI